MSAASRRSAPAFSVIVPTRDRPDSLARCLAALAQQDTDADFEIVVVDDGSRAADEVAAGVAASPRARLVRTVHGGSTQARNRGVAEARAPLVLFLDDDCEPVPGWASALLGRLGNGAVVAGLAVNANPRDALAEASQTVLDVLTRWSRAPDGSTAFAPTYNIACERRVALAVPFDESYVNAGADRDWCRRLRGAGHPILVEPRALVRHRQVTDARDFVRRHVRYGRGSRRFHRRTEERLAPPGFYLRLVREGFARGLRPGVLVCVSQVATAAGYAAEVVAARRTGSH